MPQAGVSIGLSVLASRMLPAQSGALLSTIILSSSILYELIGPASAKTSLILAGAIGGKAAETEATMPTDGATFEENTAPPQK